MRLSFPLVRWGRGNVVEAKLTHLFTHAQQKANAYMPTFESG